MEFVNRNCQDPTTEWPRRVVPGSTVHGLTDGRWTVVDAIGALLNHLGACDLVICTWTAANAEIVKIADLMNRRLIGSIQWCLDYSFSTRESNNSRLLRSYFPDEAIRLWSCHAKFSILRRQSDGLEVLYLTSANIGENKRIENYTIITGGPIPSEYLALVQDLYRLQNPGEAFDRAPGFAKAQTRQLLRPLDAATGGAGSAPGGGGEIAGIMAGDDWV